MNKSSKIWYVKLMSRLSLINQCKKRIYVGLKQNDALVDRIRNLIGKKKLNFDGLHEFPSFGRNCVKPQKYFSNVNTV